MIVLGEVIRILKEVSLHQRMM